MKFKLGFVLCALIATSVIAGHAVTSNPCGEPQGLYNERSDIDAQVDDVRHVSYVVVRNEISGDMVFEFMATRTDLPSTSERWKVTYVCDDDFDFIQEVTVDGNWKYTLTYTGAMDNPIIGLSAPGGSAHVDVLNAWNDPNLALFQSLATLTDPYQDVAQAVIDAVTGLLTWPPQQIPQPNPFQHCVTFECPGIPTFCDGNPPNCLVEHACCAAHCKRNHCIHMCGCKHMETGEAQRQCMFEVIIAENNCFSGCARQLQNCLKQGTAN